MYFYIDRSPGSFTDLVYYASFYSISSGKLGLAEGINKF
jgi:hypothetical protein